MNFKMDSKMISDPKTLTDKELLEMPLSGLSKGLSLNLSSHNTISIYLRWLEIHRQQPSNLTKLWENTIFHWAQALRSRGFTESELVHEVNSWKEIQLERNGPFRSWMHRYLPMPKDIARAYANDSASTRQNPKHDKYKPLAKSDHNTKMQKGHSEFSRPPPGNYVCNRCEGRGHHLQVCPTNMDPAYDKAPGDDYLCPICHAAGKHYKSLCPRNTDPNSINMKRRALGSGYESRDAEYGRLQNVSESPSYNVMNDKESESFERIYQLDDVKRRLERGDSVDASEMAIFGVKRENENDLKRNRADLFESRSNSPKPDQLRKKIKMEAREEDNIVMTESSDMISTKTPTNGEARGRCIITQQKNLDKYSTFEWDLPERAALAKPARKEYSNFVQKLMARRPEMSEVVNARKPRPTAADMWEESDMRRLQQMAIKTPIGSPFSWPSQSSSKTSEYFSSDRNMSGRLTPYGSPLADPFLRSTRSGGATSKAGLDFDNTAQSGDADNTEMGGMLQPDLEDDLNPPGSDNSKSYRDPATAMIPKSEPSTQFALDEDKENIKIEDYDTFGASDKSEPQSIEDNQKQSEITTGTRERQIRHNSKITTVSELQKFGSSFKLKTPIPTDLVNILAKDPEKQKAITNEAWKNVRQNGWK